MEQLLKKRPVTMTAYVGDKMEECPLSGEYTLPEYCPDVAVVLKCSAQPRIQNRQWSGDQLLLDGNAVVQVLYLDEGRNCLRSVEFAQPFSCALRCSEWGDMTNVELDLTIKYLNCRAISPRRFEVRGAVVVCACGNGAVSVDLPMLVDDPEIFHRMEKITITVPGKSCDKVLTVSESLDFNDSLPPAEMLLGGDCRAVLKECKLLPGKAIVKGQIYVHQLYTDNVSGDGTHSLDFVVPFSQILDIDAAGEGMPYHASVQVLSDTERCTVGPSGGNTVLDITAKLLLQLQMYRSEEIEILQDVFHQRYPTLCETDEIEFCSHKGTRWEETLLPMQLALPQGQWQEILDICVQPQESDVICREGRAEIKGKMLVGVVARDRDGAIVYEEFTEEYGLEYPCQGNRVRVHPVVTTIKYRTVEDKLEVQVALCVALKESNCCKRAMVSRLTLQTETPYPMTKATALFYYADAGESVWDIGRACHMSPMRIAQENDICDECVPESTVLLIPT